MSTEATTSETIENNLDKISRLSKARAQSNSSFMTVSFKADSIQCL